jgi:hypothetical protein
LQNDLHEREREIAALQAELLAILRQAGELQQQTQQMEQGRPALERRRAAAQASLTKSEAATNDLLQELATTEREQQTLRTRIAELEKAMGAVRQRPVERRALRFHLPVSRPVGEGELLFECRNGKVTFIDLQPMLEQVKATLRSKGDDLKTRWEVTDSVGPVGAFRLEYVVARERSSPIDSAFGALPPADDGQFTFGVRRWEVVPVWPERGETPREALATGSRYRTTLDALNPDHVALTFFVYEDSFAAFRELRDHAYGMGFVVAGRPLEMNRPIAGSRSGSLSRGQ